MTAKLKAMTVTSFALGMNTRRPDFKLRLTEAPFGSYQREIVNCDISDQGALKLRRGYTKKISAGSTISSLWADDNQAYYADGTTLYALTGTSAAALSAVAVTGASLSSGAPVSYETAPLGGAYWTDGASLGWVYQGASVPIVPPTPTVVPSLVVGAAGALTTGDYLVYYTYANAAGVESAATPAVQAVVGSNINVTATTGTGSFAFTLASLPAGMTLNVYVTQPNSKTPYLAHQFTTTGSYTLTTTTGYLGECFTVNLQNMPAGRFVRYNMGRLMVAVGNILYYSKPYQPGLFDPTRDFIPFPAPITVLEIVSNEGLFVVSDQTYWLEGDLAETKSLTVEQYGGVMGSGYARPDNNGCIWMSTRGLAFGGAGGKINLIQDANVEVILSNTGASILMDRDGLVQFLSTLGGSPITPESEGSTYTSSEITDISASLQTWVVNESTGASRLYTNFAFTSYAQINNHFYGVKADGVYLLEGTTDNGTPITATISPGRQDFNSPMRKRMENAYATFSSTDVMNLTITDDQGNSYTYPTRSSAPRMQQQRFDVGRGLNGNWLNFSLSNNKGAQFELNGMEINAIETRRRLVG